MSGHLSALSMALSKENYAVIGLLDDHRAYLPSECTKRIKSKWAKFQKETKQQKKAIAALMMVLAKATAKNPKRRITNICWTLQFIISIVLVSLMFHHFHQFLGCFSCLKDRPAVLCSLLMWWLLLLAFDLLMVWVLVALLCYFQPWKTKVHYLVSVCHNLSVTTKGTLIIKMRTFLIGLCVTVVWGVGCGFSLTNAGQWSLPGKNTIISPLQVTDKFGTYHIVVLMPLIPALPQRCFCWQARNPVSILCTALVVGGDSDDREWIDGTDDASDGDDGKL